MTIAERAEEYAWKEWPDPMFAIEREDCKSDYIKGATEQKSIDHSEEHLAWILQEFSKWRESNNPKVSFGEWINVSMEE